MNNERNTKFDVIVVGGGHAGLEACYISAKLGAKTALITAKFDNIGELSCNPSIGGIGKGTIVREIDALGGFMGKVADMAAIHTKMLNKSKGPAVWGLRSQIDRKLYKKAAQNVISNTKNLHIIEGLADNVSFANNKFEYISVNGEKIYGKSLVITTGTFLNGLIFQGTETFQGGRINENASIDLGNSLKNHNIIYGRLKTGTPARIYKDSINYSGLEIQEGDNPPEKFSYLTDFIKNTQTVCHITHTNFETHEIIRNARHLSPVLSGKLSSRGPRYCPSIEDKIRRFGDRDGHQVFLEPEGLDSDLIYPAGISTSTPKEIQTQWLRTIKGLENCKIAQFGYAIEYDYIDARRLTAGMKFRDIEGLYFAGQINGTTGYEEAAGQGIIAGINSALYALNKGETFELSRNESYIGVMIDDLTTLGVNNEPYRMFTSRSEYRLLIRHDNADLRLTEKAIKLGISEDLRTEKLRKKMDEINKLSEIMSRVKYSPNELLKYDINLSQDGIKRNLLELLSHKDIDFQDIIKINQACGNFSEEVKFHIETTQKYSSYIKKQEQEIELMKKSDAILIPEDINYQDIKNLSNEVIEKLNLHKPKNLTQAVKISGVTQSAIVSIINHLNNK